MELIFHEQIDVLDIGAAYAARKPTKTELGKMKAAADAARDAAKLSRIFSGDAIPLRNRANEQAHELETDLDSALRVLLIGIAAEAVEANQLRVIRELKAHYKDVAHRALEPSREIALRVLDDVLADLAAAADDSKQPVAEGALGFRVDVAELYAKRLARTRAHVQAQREACEACPDAAHNFLVNSFDIEAARL